MSGTPEYRAWYAMKERCSPKAKNDHKKHYYDRGIRVCQEWCGKDGFNKFFSHVGKRPSSDYSLDRINNNGNYEPNNVRWATAIEQHHNRRIKMIENFSDEEMIQEMNRRGFRSTKMKKHGKSKTY